MKKSFKLFNGIEIVPFESHPLLERDWIDLHNEYYFAGFVLENRENLRLLWTKVRVERSEKDLLYISGRDKENILFNLKKTPKYVTILFTRVLYLEINKPDATIEVADGMFAPYLTDMCWKDKNDMDITSTSFEPYGKEDSHIVFYFADDEYIRVYAEEVSLLFSDDEQP